MRFITLLKISIFGFVIFTHGMAAAQAPAPAVTICESIEFPKVIAAIECVRDNCSDPDGSKKDLYTNVCTDIAPESENLFPAVRVSDDGNLNTQRTLLARLNPDYYMIEAAQALRFEQPIKYTTFTPCDCLAKLESKANCKIKLCPTDSQAQAGLPGKADTAGNATAADGAGSCSLSPAAGNASPLFTWTFLAGVYGLLLNRLRKQA